jgi:hypothetical protein
MPILTCNRYFILPLLLLSATGLWSPDLPAVDDPHRIPELELEKTFSGDLPEMRKRKRIPSFYMSMKNSLTKV